MVFLLNNIYSNSLKAIFIFEFITFISESYLLVSSLTTFLNNKNSSSLNCEYFKRTSFSSNNTEGKFSIVLISFTIWILFFQAGITLLSNSFSKDILPFLSILS